MIHIKKKFTVTETQILKFYENTLTTGGGKFEGGGSYEDGGGNEACGGPSFIV